MDEYLHNFKVESYKVCEMRTVGHNEPICFIQNEIKS